MANQQDIQLAIGHQQAGRLDEAEAIYRRLLADSPDDSDAVQLLTLLLGQLGRNGQAMEIVNAAIAAKPDCAEFHNTKGEVLRRMNRWDDAIAAYDGAMRLKEHFVEACSNKGIALWFKGQTREAIAAWTQAVQWNPNFAQAHCNLGNALKESGRFEEAISAYTRALQILPGLAEARINLGNALQETGQFDQAIAMYAEVLKTHPTWPEAHNNLGNALRESGRLDEAEASIRRAIALRPTMAEAYNNLGNVLKSARRLDEAIAAYEQAIRINPKRAEAHVNLGQSLLLQSDFARGFGEYEWRWALKAALPPPLRSPRWDGIDLGGKTILLHAEGGFGDSIQFVRYVPLVVQRGGKVILQCRKELKRLMENLPGVDGFCSPGEPLPQFDAHCPLLSLPLAMGTTVQTIPAQIPYLRALGKRKLDGEGPHIGLAWAGTLDNRDAHNRHIPVHELSPLAKIKATFHSLQVGPAAADFQRVPELKMTDHSSELNDFADTAALVDALDLVITVDTAVAHLAGAMGKRVWLMLSAVPEWRWLLDREDSPWYPTMRLYRQKSAGDWRGVVARIAEALTQ